MNALLISLLLGLPNADIHVQIQQLGARRFMERERAHQRLIGYGLFAVPLVVTHQFDKDPERARRCQLILERLNYDPVLMMPRIWPGVPDFWAPPP